MDTTDKQIARLAGRAARNGVIHFGRAVIVDRNQRDINYDETVYHIPYTGAFESIAMEAGIRKVLRPKFGQYARLGYVREVRPGVLEMSILYAIGD